MRAYVVLPVLVLVSLTLGCLCCCCGPSQDYYHYSATGVSHKVSCGADYSSETQTLGGGG